MKNIGIEEVDSSNLILMINNTTTVDSNNAYYLAKDGTLEVASLNDYHFSLPSDEMQENSKADGMSFSISSRLGFARSHMPTGTGLHFYSLAIGVGLDKQVSICLHISFALPTNLCNNKIVYFGSKGSIT